MQIVKNNTICWVHKLDWPYQMKCSLGPCTCCILREALLGSNCCSNCTWPAYASVEWLQSRCMLAVRDRKWVWVNQCLSTEYGKLTFHFVFAKFFFNCSLTELWMLISLAVLPDILKNININNFFLNVKWIAWHLPRMIESFSARVSFFYIHCKQNRNVSKIYLLYF